MDKVGLHRESGFSRALRAGSLGSDSGVTPSCWTLQSLEICSVPCKHSCHWPI